MTLRDKLIIPIRESFLGEIEANFSSEEYFQNKTLRPILKLQNELVLVVFNSYIKHQKGAFFKLDDEKKCDYVQNALQKDVALKNQCKGIVIALFTSEEYDKYSQHTTAINKRITSLVIERINSQIQFFKQ